MQMHEQTMRLSVQASGKQSKLHVSLILLHAYLP